MIRRICDKEKDVVDMVINHTTPVKKHYKDICKLCASKKSKVVVELKKKHSYPDSNHICPICNRTQGKYYLDHNWETKNFRGWLCNSCNIALGLFKENIETLQRAIEYLTANKE